jgi:phosphate transport system substrate-binding protein
MPQPKLKWAIRLAGLWILIGNAVAGQPERSLYVEPFITNAGGEKLRQDLIGALRKLGSMRLVSTESSAELILGGGGEIWIRGYRSLNPRAGRSPSAGTPVYGGYLSVELHDPKGETVWSYLATPGAASADVPKELAKQIAKRLAEALPEVQMPSRLAPSPQPTILKAAGATFPAPVYAKWITNYRRKNPEVEITYEAVGSEAGVRRLLAGAIDLGASDSPEAIHEIAPDREADYLLFPSVAGAVVPIVNLPGFAGEIAFTPEALAGIYLGQIKKWNDPILGKANPRLHLPDLDIVVVHRADGSGTSYAWSDYLSRISPEWRAHSGTSLDPRWPTGRSAAGNEGVAKLVKELGGSIGYVEFIYALQNHLGFGKVRDRHGEFVAASLASIAVAVNSSTGMGDDFKASIVDPPDAGAYPIASFTWFVVPRHIVDKDKRKAIASFLTWMLGPGQKQAAALGYVALPRDVAAKEEKAIARIH